VSADETMRRLLNDAAQAAAQHRVARCVYLANALRNRARDTEAADPNGAALDREAAQELLLFAGVEQ
jgi:hypothetical protein